MSQIEIKVLGSGDAFGSGGRFQACFYIQSEAGRFLIDCGSSSLIAMKRFGVDPSAVDMILLSHLHGDHFGGVPFFILDAQFARRAHPLVIAGPPGVKRRIQEAMEVLFPRSSKSEQKFAIEFIELPERSNTAIGSLKVTPFSVIHPSGDTPYALRVQCGEKVIGYSGDTEWTETLLEVSRGADLFLCEAYFFEKNIKFHLSYRTLMEHRAQLGCRKLVLTHMGNDMLNHLRGLDVEWAEDGKSIFL